MCIRDRACTLQSYGVDGMDFGNGETFREAVAQNALLYAKNTVEGSHKPVSYTHLTTLPTSPAMEPPIALPTSSTTMTMAGWTSTEFDMIFGEMNV